MFFGTLVMQRVDFTGTELSPSVVECIMQFDIIMFIV